MNTKMILSLAAIVLTSCAAPSKQEVAAADYGPYPSNYRELVNAWIKRSMKDPYSVRDVQMGEPEKFWVAEAPILGGKKTYGYMIAVALNAKNSFGAYTGRQAYQLQIREGRVIAQQWMNPPTREVTGADWIFLR